VLAPPAGSAIMSVWITQHDGFLTLETSVAEVLDEPYSQLNPLSGVAVQGRQYTKAGTVSVVAWRAGMATQLNELSCSSKTPALQVGQGKGEE
jgi:hypothetical protein